MKPIPVNVPDLGDAERDALLDCFDSGWVSSEGPQVGQFEREFSAAVGRRYGVAVSSGTAGLDIAVRALGLGPGDEVLVPSLTIISCAHAIVAVGATPVPVDCDLVDWNAHLEHFQARVTPRTRAVMLVHLYGLCADLDPILGWAEAAGLLVIEDGSQAHGLRYNGRTCGSFGIVSVFSFYANKIITSGEGGMIVCDDELLAKRSASLRNLSFETGKRFWHRDLGWNYRLTALQAAIAVPQVRRLPELVARKRRIGLAYHQAFAHSSWFDIAPTATTYADNVYWVFGLVLRPDCPFTRDELSDALGAAMVGTRTFFYGLHQQPVLLERALVTPASLPTTEYLSKHGLYLPSGLGLDAADQERVIDVVQAFAAAHV